MQRVSYTIRILWSNTKTSFHCFHVSRSISNLDVRGAVSCPESRANLPVSKWQMKRKIKMIKMSFVFQLEPNWPMPEMGLALWSNAERGTITNED